MSDINVLMRGLSAPFDLANRAADYDRHPASQTFQAVVGFFSASGERAIQAWHERNREEKVAIFSDAAPQILKQLNELVEQQGDLPGTILIHRGNSKISIEKGRECLTVTNHAEKIISPIPVQNFDDLLDKLTREIDRHPTLYGDEAAALAESIRAIRDTTPLGTLAGLPRELHGEIECHLDSRSQRALGLTNQSIFDYREKFQDQARALEAHSSNERKNPRRAA